MGWEPCNHGSAAEEAMRIPGLHGKVIIAVVGPEDPRV